MSTIAAIATPLGEGGIGTVRISGDNAHSVADKIFKSVSGKKVCGAKGYTALFGNVYSGGELVDEAVALVFRAPHSYTGEDVVEISVHGGKFVTKKALRAALDAGAELASAGEFSKRAFLNGKLDLTQAESVMSLISAEGDGQLKMALESKNGRTSREIAEIRDMLLSVEASVAVWADYPDEDLPEISEDSIKGRLLLIKERLNKLLETYDAGAVLREGISTAIIGAPNVGKSTLMNMLSGNTRSIVTSVAGTTRDVIEETVCVNDVVLRLADTAGMHETDDTVEKIGVDMAKEKSKTAQLILAVFDSARPLSDDDREIIKLIKDKTAIAVINKCDLKQQLDLSEFSSLEVCKICAETGEGKEALCEKIEETAGIKKLDGKSAVLANERQRECAKRAFDSICEALSAWECGFTLDAVSVCADDAAAALLELTGERVTDAVADEVFSRFCVGK